MGHNFCDDSSAKKSCSRDEVKGAANYLSADYTTVLHFGKCGSK